LPFVVAFVEILKPLVVLNINTKGGLVYGGYRFLLRSIHFFPPEPEPVAEVPGAPSHLWSPSSVAVRMIPLEWAAADHHRSAIKSYQIRLHQLSNFNIKNAIVDRDVDAGKHIRSFTILIDQFDMNE
jgi:hypothetical protein